MVTFRGGYCAGRSLLVRVINEAGRCKIYAGQASRGSMRANQPILCTFLKVLCNLYTDPHLTRI